MSTTTPRLAHVSARIPEQLAHVHSLAEHAARKGPDLRVSSHPSMTHALRRVSTARAAYDAAREALTGPVGDSEHEQDAHADLGQMLDSAQAHLERERAEVVVVLERTNPGVASAVLWDYVSGL